MDGEIGGIEGLLEGLIWGLSGDQMLRDKPSENIKQPANWGEKEKEEKGRESCLRMDRAGVEMKQLHYSQSTQQWLTF